jgi:branched-subunit amino acid transport protein AzlD
MPFKIRAAIYASLWLLAGLAFAVFAKGHDPSLLNRILKFMPYAPLLLTFCVAHSITNNFHLSSQQRDFYDVFFFSVLIALCLVHAVITLTRRTKPQFMALTAIQLLFLAWSVVCAVRSFVG